MVQRQVEEEEEEQVQTKSVIEQITPLIQKQVEEEEEEQIQTKPVIEQITPLVQKQTEEEEEEQVQTKSVTEQITPLVQRQVEEEEEKELRRQPIEEEEVEQPEQSGIVRTKSLTPLYIQRSSPECDEELQQGSSNLPNIQTKSEGSFPASNKVANTLQSPGNGSLLPEYVRSKVEPVLGRDLGHVKVHSDHDANQAAQSINAKAFTHGSNIFLGNGQSPSDVQLMAHESTHTIQQGETERRIQRDEEFGEHNRSGASAALPSNATLGVDPDNPITETGIDEDESSLLKTKVDEDFTLIINTDEPHLFKVPGDISREGIAKKLTDNEKNIYSFDYVATDLVGTINGIPQRAVKMRDYSLLTSPNYTFMRKWMDSELDKAVKWTISKLKERSISDSDEWKLVSKCLEWSRYYKIKDANGVQYFDKYLNRLAGRNLSQPHWYTLTITETTKDALDWLLDETAEKSEQIRKAMELRSDVWTTYYDYKKTDKMPGSGMLRNGSVVGRFYWTDNNSGVQIRIAFPISESDNFGFAEKIARNVPYTGHKVVIPGDDKKYYGYAVVLPLLDPLVTAPEADKGGHFYWYYPDTIFIREKGFRADVESKDTDDKQQNRDILTAYLQKAIDENKPSLIIGLDYPVLKTATFKERLQIFDLVLDGSESKTDNGADLLGRLIMTTPNEEFMALERHLSTSGLIDKLLSFGQTSQRLIGHAFTQKTIMVVPFGVDSLINMPSFKYGKKGRNDYYSNVVDVQDEQTNLVDPTKWDPKTSPKLGSEPAQGNETPGPINRSTIRFTPEEVHGYFPSASKGIQTKSFLPTELVRIDFIGGQGDSRVVTALELALICRTKDLAYDMLFNGIVKVAELWALRGAGVGIGRAFGPAIMKGLTAGGLRSALAAAAAHAGTAAGKAALKTFFAELLILGSNAVVNEYRDELRKSAAGKTFLAIFDVAMLALAARDIYRLSKSGILQEVAKKGRLAAAGLVKGAKQKLLNALDDLDALEIAAKESLQKGFVREAAVAGGFKIRLAAGKEESFKSIFYSARAKLASERVLTGLSGTTKTTAKSLFTRLENLAQGNKEVAKAYSAVARKAESLTPSSAKAFFDDINQVLAAKPSMTTELSGFLRASARLTNPSVFLQDVKWLLNLNGISKETISVLSKKSAAKSVDLAWLRKTNITKDMNYLNTLASDPMTPWRLFRRAATSKGYWSTLWARVKIRGISGEIASESALARSLPGHSIQGTQVRMGNSIIDYSVKAGKLTKGVEVKGWTKKVWERALGVFKKRAKNLIPLTEKEKNIIKKMDHMIKQLKDIRATTGQKPILSVSDVVTGDIQKSLIPILRKETGGSVTLIKMTEADIVNIGRKIRTALGVK